MANGSEVTPTIDPSTAPPADISGIIGGGGVALVLVVAVIVALLAICHIHKKKKLSKAKNDGKGNY